MNARRPVKTRSSSLKRRRAARPILDRCEDRLLLSIAPQVVTTTANGGPGSLLAAVTAVNADTGGGIDRINFNLPTSAPLYIPMGAGMPSITHSVIIDATTQPGYTNKPIVVLNGAAAGGAGLDISADNSVVEGIVIQGFTGDGIRIDNASGVLITNDYVGTDLSGSVAVPNRGDGIALFGASNCTIGGFTTTGRDIISANGGNGISITGPNASGNVIVGNFIGVDASSGVALGNGGDGILLSTANNTTIGGVALSAHNVISTNGLNGIEQAGGSGTLVQGNYIGTNDATGNESVQFLGNLENGVSLSGASNVTIGGSVNGARNVISENDINGVIVQYSSGVVVLGNNIGTNVAGTSVWAIVATPLGETFLETGNVFAGIEVNSSSGTTIGGTTPADRNLISGNVGQGILIQNGSTATLVEGNYIGVDTTGAVDLGQGADGIEVLQSSGTTIGGTTADAGNLISGNGDIPVPIPGFPPYLFIANGISLVSSSGNVIEGNLIGTDATGQFPIANEQDGILVNSSGSNTIGGTAAGSGNLVSGNSLASLTGLPGYGVSFTFGSLNNLIAGNTIGLNLGGTAALPNDGDGVNFDAAQNNTIGGSTASARNLISGNLGAGITLTDLTSGTVIQGNYIGTDVTSTVPLGNIGNGILIFNSSNNLIGGKDPGEGNVISGTLTDTSQSIFLVIGDINTFANGIQIAGSAASSNLIQGNNIGTDASGTLAVGNIGLGIFVNGGSHNSIGGDAAGEGNLISGNGFTPLTVPNSGFYYPGTPIYTIAAGFTSMNPAGGILIFSSGAAGNIVQGNKIGTDITGEAAIPNFFEGVILANAPDNSIGGTSAGAGNLISGNDAAGIEVMGQDSSVNSIEGNTVGLDATGTMAIPNLGNGVVIDMESRLAYLDPQIQYYSSPKNTIGGTIAGAGNLISGNVGDGVVLDGTAGNSNDNLIAGNVIGTDITTTLPIPNSFFGIEVINATNATVGGFTAGSGNIIAASGRDGLALEGVATINAVIQGNDIGTNASGGLGLGNFLDGIRITGVSGALIGGESSGDGNVIADNRQTGLTVLSGTGDQISGNSIYGNANLGIDLGGTGAVLANHPGQAQNVPNHNQNYPVVTAAVSNATSGTTIEASLSALPNQTYTIEFFSSPAADPSGYGQGETYIGSTTVTTDQNGFAKFFTSNFPSVVLSGGQFISATATDSQGNTSEFSKDLPVLGNTVPQADLGVSITATPSTGVANTDLVYTLGVTDNGPLTATGVVVTLPIPAGTQLFDVLTELGTYTLSGNMLTFNIASISPGFTTNITVTVIPTGAETVVATASVSGSRLDLVPNNNQATITTTVLATETSDLSISLSNTDATPWLNSNIIYTIQVSNAGPTDASGTLLTDTLPAGVKLFSVTTPQGSYVQSGNVLTFAMGTLPVNQSVTLTVVATALSSGNLASSVSVTANGTDPDPTNNLSSSSITIAPPGSFSLGASSYSISSTAGMETITVNRIGGSGGPATVAFGVAAGSAVAGTEFTPVSGVLSFANGQTSASFSFPVIDKTAVNGTFTVLVSLNSPTGGAALAAPTSATVSITENHPPQTTGGSGNGGGTGSTGSSSGGSSGSTSGSTGSSTGSQTPPAPHYEYVKIGKHIVRILVGGTYQSYYNPYYWYNRNGKVHNASVVVTGVPKKKHH